MSPTDGHDGFSGRILGRPDRPWHLELVAAAGHAHGGGSEDAGEDA